MKHFLFCNQSDPNQIATWRDLAVNKGIEAIITRPSDFQGKGPLEIVNTGTMSEEDRMHQYFRALMPSILKQYRVRKIFGSQRHAGFLFGREVPALVVWPDVGDSPEDVYPHEKMGRTVTIYEYLTGHAPA